MGGLHTWQRRRWEEGENPHLCRIKVSAETHGPLHPARIGGQWDHRQRRRRHSPGATLVNRAAPGGACLAWSLWASGVSLQEERRPHPPRRAYRAARPGTQAEAAPPTPRPPDWSLQKAAAHIPMEDQAGRQWGTARQGGQSQPGQPRTTTYMRGRRPRRGAAWSVKRLTHPQTRTPQEEGVGRCTQHQPSHHQDLSGPTTQGDKVTLPSRHGQNIPRTGRSGIPRPQDQGRMVWALLGDQDG